MRLYISIIFYCFSLACFSQNQFSKADSIGHFYVIDHHVTWQKWYDVKNIEALQEQFRQQPITTNLNLFGYKKSALIGPLKISCDGIVPTYAQHKFTASVSVFDQQGRLRVSITGFNYPEFVTNRYYNGINSPQGGTLDHYLLRRDGTFKQNQNTFSILKCYDDFFRDVFDEAVYQANIKEE